MDGLDRLSKQLAWMWRIKINKSKTSSAFSQLAYSGVEEQQLLKIIALKLSIKPHLNLDLEHPNKFMNITFGNRSSVVENSNESNVEVNFDICSFTNFTFDR